MKKNFRSVLSLALALALCLSTAALAGCGDEAKKKVTGEDDADIAGAYDGIKEYSGTTVKFATWIDHTQGEGAAPMASFAEKYNIDVELVAAPQNEYITKVLGMIAAGQSPDVVVDNLRYPLAFQLCDPLDDVKSVNLEDEFWDKQVIEQGSVNGKHYLINSKNSPWSYRYVCYYNKKLFEDNGFKTPAEYVAENNWTVDTFKKCAKQISSLGDDIMGASVRLQCAGAIWGKQIVTRDVATNTFSNNSSDATLINAYRWAMEGKDEGIFTTSQMSEKLSKNQLGLEILGDFGSRATGSYSTADPDILGVVPMPKAKASDANYPQAQSWRAYGICKGSKNAEAAGYFLRWFLDFENYDTANMFKSAELEKFYTEIREMDGEVMHIVAQGVMDLSAGEGSFQTMFKTITDSTSAQVTVNMKILSNKIEDVVQKASDIMEDVKKSQE